MYAVLFDALMADHQAGKASLMVAGETATVADLKSRAQARRVAAGDADPGGVTTRDGERVGVGDVIVTLLNRRSLAAGAGWVKNGDDWLVVVAADDGSLTVARPEGTGWLARRRRHSGSNRRRRGRPAGHSAGSSPPQSTPQ